MKPLFLFLLAGLAFAQAPQYPVLPGGSGGGGAVSSVFGRTGGVVAATNDYSVGQISGNITQTFNGRTGTVVPASGDYTAAQITYGTAQPPLYSCSTSSYTAGSFSYACSTGASLSAPPPDGTLLVVNFAQACTGTAALQITVDSLPTKQIFSWDGTSSSTVPLCAQANEVGLLRASNPSGSALVGWYLIGFGQFPACPNINEIMFTNGSGLAVCSPNLQYVAGNVVLLAPHMGGNKTNLPSIASGTGAGTSPTVALSTNSNDFGGEISITTGAAPATGATVVTITWGVAYATAPFCSFSPTNSNAALLTGITSPYMTTTTTTAVLTSGTTGLTAATAYKWAYHCTQ